MSAKTTQQIRQSLTNKGFVEVKSHHCFFYLCINEKRYNIFTRFSHGEKECGDPLLGRMAQQLRLRRKDFDNLIDCQLGKEAYIQMLKDKGEL